MGVWIETVETNGLRIRNKVTPCVGVWIETKQKQKDVNSYESHPAWVCGLKQE